MGRSGWVWVSVTAQPGTSYSTLPGAVTAQPGTSYSTPPGAVTGSPLGPDFYAGNEPGTSYSTPPGPVTAHPLEQLLGPVTAPNRVIYEGL